MVLAYLLDDIFDDMVSSYEQIRIKHVFNLVDTIHVALNLEISVISFTE